MRERDTEREKKGEKISKKYLSVGRQNDTMYFRNEPIVYLQRDPQNSGPRFFSIDSKSIC